MQIRQLLAQIASSKVTDWEPLFRPTLRHRLTEILDEKGKREQFVIDEHLVSFVYRPDIAITMAYGLVEQAALDLPPDHPFGRENARSLLLDIFYEGRLAHRETVVSIDRHRCLLPMPASWELPISVSTAQFSLVRLLHALAGPPTDYDTYFQECGMVRSDAVAWP